MDRYVSNAFRLLGLRADATLDQARAAAVEAKTAGRDTQEALPRLEDWQLRLREHVFGPADPATPRGRAVEAHAAAIAGARSPGAWRESLGLWAGLIGDPGFRESLVAWGRTQPVGRPMAVDVDALLKRLPVDLLGANVSLGRKALDSGDRGGGAAQAQVIRESPFSDAAKNEALGALAEPAAREVIERGKVIRQALAGSPGRGGADRETVRKYGEAIDGAAALVEREILPRAELLTVVPHEYSTIARDDAAVTAGRLGGACAALGRDDDARKWLETGVRLAVTPGLKSDLEADLRDPGFSLELQAALALCRTGQVEKCRSALEGMLGRAKDPARRGRLEAILAEPRRMAAPISSAPTMTTLNGVGAMLYGRRDFDPEDNTYVKTQCFCLVFIPIWPIAAYLVRDAASGWNFFARVPLSPFARLWKRFFGLFVGVPVLLSIGWAIWANSDSVQEGKVLDRAEAVAQSGSGKATIEVLASVLHTEDAGRRSRMARIARGVIAVSIRRVDTHDDARTFLREDGAALRSVPPEVLRGWFDASLDAEMLSCLDRLEKAVPAGGSLEAVNTRSEVLRDFIDLTRVCSPALGPRRIELAMRAIEACECSRLFAAIAEWHVQEAKPLPDPVRDRFVRTLEAGRHATWDADAIALFRIVPPDQAPTVFRERLKDAWLGRRKDPGLLELKSKLPRALVSLLDADEEQDRGKRVVLYEKLFDEKAMPNADIAWHQAGVARRLAVLYGELNEEDGAKWGWEKARDWAIKAAELLPGDGEAAAIAIQWLLAAGDVDRALAIGEMASADPAVSTWLGIAHARAGHAAEAERILEPFVAEHLPPYIEAVKAWEARSAQIEQQLYESLRNGTANQGFIDRLNSLPEEDANAEIRQWIADTNRNDAGLAEITRKARAHGDARLAARELAMARLALGRALPPGEARTKKLSEAEKLFLDLRKVSSDDPGEEIALAQVYCWLGKEKEAEAIVAALEAAGDARVLMDVADMMRELGRIDRAKALLEIAWGKLEGEEKNLAATKRAVYAQTVEDKLVWLARCQETPGIRALMAETRAEQAQMEGKYAEAIPHLQESLTYWKGLPEESTTLNNAALVLCDLYRATGDASFAREAVKLSRRACELDPDNPIDLGNCIEATERLGWILLAGDTFRFDVLHDVPDVDWVSQAWADVPVDQRAERVRKQPELRRAAELGARAMIVSPDRDEGFDAQLQYLSYAREASGLHALRGTIEAAPPVRSEEAETARRGRRGEWKPEWKVATSQWIARRRLTVEAARKSGHSPTLARALSDFSVVLESGFVLGVEHASLEEAIGAAEEALSLHDTPGFRAGLFSLLGERSAVSLKRSDPEFRRWSEAVQDARGLALLCLFIDRHPESAAAIRELPDIRRIGELAARQLDAVSRAADVVDWAGLFISGHSRLGEEEKRLSADPMERDYLRIRHLLGPESSNSTFWAYLAARASGDKPLAEKIAADARAREILPAYFGPK